MRQVNRDELIWRLKMQLKMVKPLLRQDFASRETRRHDNAVYQLAVLLADKSLYGLEVLSSAPLPPGTDLFSAAAHGSGAAQGAAIEDFQDPFHRRDEK